MKVNKNLYQKLAVLIVLLVIAFVSITVISDYATSVEVHAVTLEELDEKKMAALGLTASVTAVSTAISAIPGDVATPIAEQLSELTTPLLIIVCAIYLEKFLLTTLGYVSFEWLIPIACVLVAIYLFWKKEFLKEIAIKLTIFALAIVCIIPMSVKVTGLIEATFEQSITQTYEVVDEMSEEAEKAAEEEESCGFLAFLTGLGDQASSLVENAKNALSVFVDAVAVLIITTCVIPAAVLLFFVWLVKMLFGLEMKSFKTIKNITEIEG